MQERSPLRTVRWMGNSLKVLRSFLEGAQEGIERSLMLV
jgi:hypothetical protein